MSKQNKDQSFEDLISTKDETPEMDVLFSSAEYWDFSQNATFIGTYLNDHFGPDEDYPDDLDKQKLIGYDCKTRDGKIFIIGNSFGVQNAFDAKPPGSEKSAKEISKETGRPFYIKFEGKKEMKGKGGKSINHFTIGLLKS